MTGSNADGRQLDAVVALWQRARAQTAAHLQQARASLQAGEQRCQQLAQMRTEYAALRAPHQQIMAHELGSLAQLDLQLQQAEASARAPLAQLAEQVRTQERLLLDWERKLLGLARLRDARAAQAKIDRRQRERQRENQRPHTRPQTCLDDPENGEC